MKFAASAPLFLLFLSIKASAQSDAPYACFGYTGKVLHSAQEPQQRRMLRVPNTDTTALATQLGLDPAKNRYYLFDKKNQVIATDSLSLVQTARFLSVDPLTKDYPELTPYQFASNTPIWAMDLDGREAYFTNTGNFLKWGEDNSKTAPVIVVNNENTVQLKLSVSQFLNRVHWAYGEGQGMANNYYSHTIHNKAEKQGEDEMYTSMSAGESVKSAAGQVRRYFTGNLKSANKNYNNFYNRFRGGENTAENIANVNQNSYDAQMARRDIASTIEAITNPVPDPTGGADSWSGGAPTLEYDQSNNKKGTPVVQVNQKTAGGYKSVHIFYQRGKKHQADKSTTTTVTLDKNGNKQ